MRVVFISLVVLMACFRPFPMRACTDPVAVEAINSLAAATRALAIQDEEVKALQTLQDLEARIRCADAPVSARTLSRLTFLSAYLGWVTDEPDELVVRRLSSAFGLNPDLEWDNGLGEAEELQSFLALFQQAKKVAGFVVPAKLRVGVVGSDALLYVDGRGFAASVNPQPLLSGRHLVQRQGRDKRFTGVWLDLPSGGLLEVTEKSFPPEPRGGRPSHPTGGLGLRATQLRPLATEAVLPHALLNAGLAFALEGQRPGESQSTRRWRLGLSVTSQVVAAPWESWKLRDSNAASSDDNNGQLTRWAESTEVQVLATAGLLRQVSVKHLVLRAGWLAEAGLSTGGICYRVSVPDSSARGSSSTEVASTVWQGNLPLGVLVTGPELVLGWALSPRQGLSLEVRGQALAGLGLPIPWQSEGLTPGIPLSDLLQLSTGITVMASQTF